MRPSLPSRMVPGVIRVMRRNRRYTSAAGAQEFLDDCVLRPRPYGPPRRLRRDVEIAVDSSDGWPVYTVTPTATAPHGNTVYVHGGGWVGEIVSQHWSLVAHIAAEAATTVTVPIYPLVPFGTADRVVAGVVDLVRRNRDRFGQVHLAGDSAGGQIALSAAIVLRDVHNVTVPRTVLISPAVDLSMTNPEIDRIQPVDPWLGREGTRLFIDHWRGELPLDDPRVSPIAADPRGLGPLTVFTGTRDIVHPDARLLVDNAASAGVDVDYHEGRNLLHVYPLLPTPEGRAARSVIVDRLTAPC
ncbi:MULTISPECIES: alpha/beta hydrolase fold domain-containing protein [Rhodococcus]|uniref:alpha/beta hydrolase fold domain-containing protein n=1 Tax=Rhodococcus TaxID=1827 RepID=UPI001CF85CEA|nr:MULTISPECIES: alpha/beta hydrolase fold domain-containing protein [Rhodococcus]